MDIDVTDTLQQFLEAHSVSTHREGQAVVAGNMSATAGVFRKHSANVSNLLQLDVNVSSPLLGKRTLTESFAGWGDNEKLAINNAWEKFSTASLHVLLEVFVNDKRDDDQVEWEAWENQGNAWQVCMGPLFLLSFSEEPLPEITCGELLDQLRDVLLASVVREVHWLRFYCMKEGSNLVGSECLLDNEPWPEGQELVGQWNWPDGFYSARLFCIMLPDEAR